mmetsp:Transcript_22225/g.88200  ORF Transcript_22225/g.88200 Transcript_22225/m.88200 type:complete len:224 (+) Transcript_22225:42-713(+)
MASSPSRAGVSRSHFLRRVLRNMNCGGDTRRRVVVPHRTWGALAQIIKAPSLEEEDPWYAHDVRERRRGFLSQSSVPSFLLCAWSRKAWRFESRVAPPAAGSGDDTGGPTGTPAGAPPRRSPVPVGCAPGAPRRSPEPEDDEKGSPAEEELGVALAEAPGVSETETPVRMSARTAASSFGGGGPWGPLTFLRKEAERWPKARDLVLAMDHELESCSASVERVS